jgi:hypothetical protein
MKTYLILLLTIFTVSSCQQTPAELFVKDGVSISSPAGWEITDREQIDEGAYYLAIEKNGINSSALLALTWVEGDMDLYDWTEIYKDELESNIIYKNSNLTFEKVKKDSFNGITTVALKYTASIITMDHEGVIHFSHKNDKAFAILRQEAVEDRAKNKKGFSAIERSFNTQLVD